MKTLDQKVKAIRKRLPADRERTHREEIEAVQAACCVAFDVSPNEMLGRSRERRINDARMASMALCREMLPPRVSLREIGDAHHRDHGMVLHAVNAVKAIAAIDASFNAKLNAVNNLLRSGL